MCKFHEANNAAHSSLKVVRDDIVDNNRAQGDFFTTSINCKYPNGIKPNIDDSNELYAHAWLAVVGAMHLVFALHS